MVAMASAAAVSCHISSAMMLMSGAQSGFGRRRVSYEHMVFR
jgi:hypothetical protein